MEPIPLEKLEAKLVRLGDAEDYEPAENVTTAQGMVFVCPGCYRKNGGIEGTHSILVWFSFRGVPVAMTPGPGRWRVSGSNLKTLSLQPSVNCGCWHGFIKNGTAVG